MRGIMRRHGETSGPARADQINALPEGQVHVVNRGEMPEEPHPEDRQRFMVKPIRAVMAGEISDLLPHPGERLFRRHLVDVTESDGDMGEVGEVRRRECGLFETGHQFCNLGVARKITLPHAMTKNRRALGSGRPAFYLSVYMRGGSALASTPHERAWELHRLSGMQLAPSKEQDERSYDRHDKPGRMKRRSVCGFRK